MCRGKLPRETAEAQEAVAVRWLAVWVGASAEELERFGAVVRQKEQKPL